MRRFALVFVLAFGQPVSAQTVTGIARAADGSTASASIAAHVAPPSGSALHRPWMVYAYTDFYFPNHKPIDTATLRLVASRADRLTNGDTALWRGANRHVEQMQYTLFWFAIATTADTLGASGIAPVDTFLVAHGFPIESAFLHRAGTSQDLAHRLMWVAHNGDSAVAFNPADPGFRAYQTQRLAALKAHGYAGVFYDVFGRGGVAKAFKSAEGDSAWYQSQLTAALKAEREVTGAEIVINLGSYDTPFDSLCAIAAGGAHLELTNNPLGHNLAAQLNYWRWIDHLVAAGVQRIEFVSNLAWTDRVPSPAGNDVAPIGREKMAEYASYLMAKDPGSVVAFAPDNYWNQSPAEHWLPAWDTDIGRPLGQRAQVASGTDPVGQGYAIWRRAYTHAVILMRTTSKTSTNYGDATSVSIPIGAIGRLLRSDGTTAPPDSTVHLRAGEGVVVLTP